MGPDRLMRVATAYLARHSASTQRLRDVLGRRIARGLAREGEPPPDAATLEALIEPVVERLGRAGLLDDAAFARGRVANLARKGRPAWRIKAELASGFGVDVEAVGLADDLAAIDPHAQALRWARRRRLGPFRSRDREVRRERDIASLARAGFPADIARGVIDGDGTGPEEAETGAA